MGGEVGVRRVPHGRRAGVREHERLRVVDDHAVGHAAEVPERLLVAGQELGEALAGEGDREHPARVAERADEHLGGDAVLADPAAHLTEVDLGLLPGRGLEAHRGGRGERRHPERAHRTADDDLGADEAPLAQLAVEHGRVEADLRRASGQPRRMRVQARLRGAPLSWAVRAARAPPAHGLRIEAELAGDADQGRAAREGLQHRLDDLRPYHGQLRVPGLPRPYPARPCLHCRHPIPPKWTGSEFQAITR
jgi:hypothetical protein